VPTKQQRLPLASGNEGEVEESSKLEVRSSGSWKLRQIQYRSSRTRDCGSEAQTCFAMCSSCKFKIACVEIWRFRGSPLQRELIKREHVNRPVQAFAMQIVLGKPCWQNIQKGVLVMYQIMFHDVRHSTPILSLMINSEFRIFQVHVYTCRSLDLTDGLWFRNYPYSVCMTLPAGYKGIFSSGSLTSSCWWLRVAFCGVLRCLPYVVHVVVEQQGNRTLTHHVSGSKRSRPNNDHNSEAL